MNTVKIELEIPEDIFINLKQSQGDLKKEIILTMAIELYKKGKLSLGKAAELCGFTKIAFIDMLNFKGETIFNYSESEINNEILNIRNLQNISH